MNDHLSQQQFEDCILGRADDTALEHVNVCRECRAEMDAFKSALSVFRNAVRHRIDTTVGAVREAQARQRAALIYDRPQSRRADIPGGPRSSSAVARSLKDRPPLQRLPKWRWTLVAAAFIAVILLPFFMHRNISPAMVEQTSVEIEMSPDAVMERLNRHLSRTVPAPMEPLLIPSEPFATNLGGER